MKTLSPVFYSLLHLREEIEREILDEEENG